MIINTHSSSSFLPEHNDLGAFWGILAGGGGREIEIDMGSKDRNALLPVSGLSQDGDDDLLIKGSYMSKRGMYAAVSYMACAGKLKRFDFYFISLLPLILQLFSK